MCGRYFQQRGPASVARYFGTVNPVPNTPASWNRARPRMRWWCAATRRPAPATSMRCAGAWCRAGRATLRRQQDDQCAGESSPKSQPSARPSAGAAAWSPRTASTNGAPRARPSSPSPSASGGEPMALAGLWEGWRARSIVDAEQQGPIGDIRRNCRVRSGRQYEPGPLEQAVWAQPAPIAFPQHVKIDPPSADPLLANPYRQFSATHFVGRTRL